MSENDTRWPAEDPWWRFTPKNLAVGYLSLFASLIFLGGCVLTLLDEHASTRQTIFSAVLAVIAVLWLVRAANGLKVLLRRRARR